MVLKVGVAAPPKDLVPLTPWMYACAPMGEGTVQEAPVCCVGKKAASGRRWDASCVRKEVLKVKLLKVGVAAPPQRPRTVHFMAVRLRPHHA